MTDRLIAGEELIEGLPSPPILRYEYVTGEHELLSVLESPTVRRTDGIRVRVLNDTLTEQQFVVRIEHPINRFYTTEQIAIAPHRDWGLGFTPNEFVGFYWVRIYASSPFVLPVVQFIRPTSTGWNDLYVYRPSDFATFERTRPLFLIRRTRIW